MQTHEWDFWIIFFFGKISHRSESCFVGDGCTDYFHCNPLDKGTIESEKKRSFAWQLLFDSKLKQQK